MLFTPSEITRFVNPVQPEKAALPILDTLPGMKMLFNLVQPEKTPSLCVLLLYSPAMLNRLSGNVTLSKLLQP